MTERKKTLLKEGTIRRFMKLAELDTLSSNFLNEYELEEQDDDPTAAEADYDEAYEDEGEAEGFEAGEEAAEAATPEDMVEELVGEIAAAVTKVTGIPVSVDGGEGEVEDVEAMDDLDDLAADEEVLDMAEPDLPGDELAEDVEEELTEDAEEELEEDKDWGSKKDEYKRRKGPKGVEHKAGDVKGHYKDYEKQEESVRLDNVDLIDDEALVQEIAQRVAQRLMKK